MRLADAARLWLQHVNHPTRPQCLQFILLFFSAPCFQLSHFCFKRAYAIQLRRMSLTSFDGLVEGLQDQTLKLNGLGAKRLFITQITIAFAISNAARRLVIAAAASATTMVIPPQMRRNYTSN
jgi:hypothetical protein